MANQVIAEILRQGRGKPRRRVLAALVTGRVESNFRNLPGGDADSQGWRQERASLYRNPRNLRASVRRFYQEAAQHDRGQGAGRLAADVQRPAAQYRGRYAQHMSEARQILAGRGGTSLGSTSGGGGGSRARAQLSPGQAVNVAELLSSRGGGPAESRPSITPPAAPSFSTQVTTPEGYHPIEAVAAQPRTDYGSAISKIASAAASGPGVQIQRSGRRGAGSGGLVRGVGPSGGPTGKVRISPGADRAGVPIKRGVVRFVGQVAGRSGMPLTIGTGSNHSRLTVNGNVSDHWRGAAADVPLRGSALVRAGRSALVAAGMSRRQARKVNGGLFNVGDWQIIFNTQEGGDHTDHLHVGRRGR